MVYAQSDPGCPSAGSDQMEVLDEAASMASALSVNAHRDAE
jgi:hypothetical protein